MTIRDPHCPQNILVSGGAGFIGTNFVRYWHDKYPSNRIVVLDALTYAGNLMGLSDLIEQSSVTFVHGDICDASLVADVLHEYAIDTVVHFAAESHVDKSIAASDQFIRTNVLGTHSLLCASRDYWLGDEKRRTGCRFHHVSTDEVFGSLDPQEPPFREDTRYQPNSPYAASKAASDHLVRAWYRTYGVPVVGTNCSNNFGPYQYPEKLIPLMVVNALEGRALPVYGDGLNIRDWLYVEDHCRAIDEVVRRGDLGTFYNVGGGNERSNVDVVCLLCQLVDEAFRSDPELSERFPNAPAARGESTLQLITFVRDRPGHDRRYAIDSSKLERDLAFRLRWSFEASLRATVLWYMNNERWWRSVMDGSYREWIVEHYEKRR